MSWRRALAVAAFGCLGAACSDDPPAEGCPPRPSFRVTVEVEQGALPDDTALRVVFGGNQTEVFELENPDAEHHAVLCSGWQVDGEPLESFACDLWTNGAATVYLTGGDYEDVEQELEADPDECVTTEVTLRFERADGR
jgi:hypothetical protein